MLTIFYLVQYKHITMDFKNFVPIDRNIQEFFCESVYTKHLYYVYHFLEDTWFCAAKWHMLISLCVVQYKYAKIHCENFFPISRNVPEKGESLYAKYFHCL